MRPSKNLGEVGVLDTRRECQIVLEAFEDKDFARSLFEPFGGSKEDWEKFADSTIVRLRSQTHHEPHPPRADAYVEPVWNDQPEFIVKDSDIVFIFWAAVDVLSEKGLVRKVYNRVTGRRKAAGNIMSGLFHGVLSSPSYSQESMSDELKAIEARLRITDTNE